ncbi:MAG TPA: glycosyltransferase family A protein [Acidobacteriaceae bacterium]|nr:glycosyltransferase family A protein [Acidobacteriaceae bacterium]
MNSVTVVIPHFNRPEFIRNAVMSVRNQTVPPAEILVVDDCSTPENQVKLRELSDLATIITTPRNLGLAGARNFGARNAKGEWLAFLDDDDCYLPDKHERQIRYLEAHPHVKALGGGMTMVTPDGKEEYWGGKPTRKVTLAYALCFTACTVPSMMIRRDTFDEVGGFDERLRHFEDLEFGIRLLASGTETHFLAEPLFIYHRGGGRAQLSAQWRKMFNAEMNILDMHAELVRKEFGPLGRIRLKARCRKKHGIWMGRLEGRSTWALGCLTEAIFGRHPEHLAHILPPMDGPASGD